MTPDTPFFDFDAEEGTDPDEEFVPSATFKIAGRQWTCRPYEHVPAGLVDTIVLAYQGHPVQIGPFFEAVLIPEDQDAFREMLRSPNSPLTLAKLTPIVKFVAEGVLRRPTGRPDASPRGPSSNGRGSKGGSSSRATARTD